MNFNKHLDLVGQHAFLGASNYHWLYYDEAQLVDHYRTAKAAERGTQLHEIAATLIAERIKLEKAQTTFNMYVNDAIGFKMKPEQVLYYSENCFGTADAISFRKKFLRIHDLKTGVTPAHMEQLEIYAALFCLEYDVNPSEIEMELRIYQSNDIKIFNPGTSDIVPIMDEIITKNKIITELRSEEI